jgi:hypothetical protein
VMALKKLRQYCTILSGSCGIKRRIEAPRISTSWTMYFAVGLVSFLSVDGSDITYTKLRVPQQPAQLQAQPTSTQLRPSYRHP